MDTNHVLTMLVVLSSGILFLRTLRQRSRATRGWCIKSGLILALSLALFLVEFPWAGVTSMAVWATFLFVPLILTRVAMRWVTMRQYGRASLLFKVLRWLHPLDGWWNQHRLARALQLAEEGEVDAAGEMLDTFKTADSALARVALIHGYRILNRWPDLLEWFVSTLKAPSSTHHPELFSLYLRALGETGNRDVLIESYASQADYLRKVPGNAADYSRMVLFSFCGEEDGLRVLFEGKLAVLPDDTKAYWSLLTRDASGEDISDSLHNLASTAGPGISRAAQWRLSLLDRDEPPPLSAAQLQVVADATHEAELSRTYSRGSSSKSLPIATYGLLLANLVFFGIEMSHGSTTDAQNLVDLGAVVTPYVLDGQWWRLLTGSFLHAGWLHLSLNMLGLLWLAPFLERRFGLARFLLLYALTACGGMLVATAVSALTNQPGVLVGASAGVMGLIGATAGFMWSGWWKEKARPAVQGLRQMLVIVALQTTFDLLTPQVSMSAHLGGALIGFVVVLSMVRRPAPGRANG